MQMTLRPWRPEDAAELAAALDNPKIHANLRDGLPLPYTKADAAAFISAMLAAEQHVVTPALERVIEANTYLSGVGFESGGLAAAHAIHNGMTAIPDAHHYYHGEKVAFGTLTQLVLENAPVEEIETVAALCHSVGLPITLAQLDIKGDIPTKMRLVAEAACAEGETIHNMPGGVDSDQVYAALLVADQYGQRFLQEWE